MKTSSFFQAAVLAVSLLAVPTKVSAQVIYLENFTNGVDNGIARTQVGWSSIGVGRSSIGVDNTIYYNTAPVFVPGTTVLTTASNGTLPGPNNTLAGVNNTGTFASPTNGAAGTGFTYVNGTDYKAFLAYAGDGLEYFGTGRTLSSSSLSEVRIQSGLTTSGAAGTVVPAVLVGTQWYVYTGAVNTSPTTVANAAGFTASSSFNIWDASVFSSLSWATLDTTTVTSNSLTIGGTSAALPVGNVNAIGVYGSGFATGGNFRLDNFQVTVVPEPSAALLLGFSAGAVLIFRRRRPRIDAA